MEVSFIPSEMINSDLGVVNNARVSLAKHHDTFIEPDDTRLIRFLAQNNHISPFFHPRLYFWMHMSVYDQLNFFKFANQAGFSWIQHGTDNYDSPITIKGSLFGWLNGIETLTKKMRGYVNSWLSKKFPHSHEAFFNLRQYEEYQQPDCIMQSEDIIINNAALNKDYYKLLSATLRVKIPLFVARQIRTSKVGFAYSDLYVESESFDFNEVSRRYVSDEPEFYKITEWRVREGGRVKQGSTGIADQSFQDEGSYIQRKVQEEAWLHYQHFNSVSIAPEQARILLPQSMYTEWFQTATLHRWAQFCKLRIDPHVQAESQEVAVMIRDCLSKQFPGWKEVYNL